MEQTLKEAVVGVIEVFISEGEPFTLFDIRESIQDLVNSGWIDIPELPYCDCPIDILDDSSELVTSRSISALDVNKVFNELYENREIDVEELDRSYRGVYFSEVTEEKPDQPWLEYFWDFQGSVVTQKGGVVAKANDPIEASEIARVHNFQIVSIFNP